MPSVTHPLLAASLAGHDAFVEGVEFSSNGKYIMSSSSGKQKTEVCNRQGSQCCPIQIIEFQGLKFLILSWATLFIRKMLFEVLQYVISRVIKRKRV